MKTFFVLAIFIFTNHAIARGPRPAPRPTQQPATKAAMYRSPPRSTSRIPKATTFKPDPTIPGSTAYRPVPSLMPSDQRPREEPNVHSVICSSCNIRTESGKESTDRLRVSLYDTSVAPLIQQSFPPILSEDIENPRDQTDLVDLKVPKVGQNHLRSVLKVVSQKLLLQILSNII